MLVLVSVSCRVCTLRNVGLLSIFYALYPPPAPGSGWAQQLRSVEAGCSSASGRGAGITITSACNYHHEGYDQTSRNCPQYPPCSPPADPARCRCRGPRPRPSVPLVLGPRGWPRSVPRVTSTASASRRPGPGRPGSSRHTTASRRTGRMSR